ncbi:MAG: hypothetical protein JKX69_00665 [Rhodobacteraceae bacterium]|nr:hypothetical protein [Paracoccaceae bacterium]
MRNTLALCIKTFTLCIVLASPALADLPQIVSASAQQQSDGWRFDVTLRHPDSGWDHYADGWEILLPDGSSAGLRVLAHPHEAEQPFTRSLGGVTLPEGTQFVRIRARCIRDGWTDDSVVVELARP